VTIREIREITGLSQSDFGKHYNIPLPTIKKWEADIKSQNYRECPTYVKDLLERGVRIDYVNH
jgi:putative transcriptional regulator